MTTCEFSLSKDFKNKNSVIPYDSGISTKTQYWAILMDQIYPIEEMDDMSYLTHFNRMEDADKKSLRRTVKRSGDDLEKSMAKDMINILNDYEKIGITNRDIHAGNVGVNSEGRLVSFDPKGDVSGYRRVKEIKV